MNSRYIRGFQYLVTFGAILGLLLLVEAVISYKELSGQLVRDHLSSQASHLVSRIEAQTAGSDSVDRRKLTQVLEGLLVENQGLVAWIRASDLSGDILARTPTAPVDPVSAGTISEIVNRRERYVVSERESAQGPVLVYSLPLRFRLSDEAPRALGLRGEPGQPRFKIGQVALYPRGSRDLFRGLRRNLIVSIAAGSALIASMALAALLFPRYLRGRQLEQQLSLARQVQRELLPAERLSCRSADFAARFIPFWEVGGDYYDVSCTSACNLELVLGDVSGKGLPAALLMGVLHGALRASSDVDDGSSQAVRVGRINSLLTSRIAENKFISLFAASYSGSTGELTYVNAGHPPPVLLHQGRGESRMERLETGGPVLGLLPDASYQEGRVAVDMGDVLLVFSDGLTEATDRAGREFGEERVVQALESQAGRTAQETAEGIVDEVSLFVGPNGLHDDLTLLVVRFGSDRDYCYDKRT